jgi:hypothetical protein
VQAIAPGVRECEAYGGRHGAARVPSPEARVTMLGLKEAESNNGMHPTRRSSALMNVGCAGG